MRPQRNVLTTRPSRHKHTHLPPSPTPSTHSFLHFHIFSTWTLPMGLNTAHGNNNQRHNKRKPTHPHLLPSSTNTHNTAQLQISWRFIEHANLPHTDMARHGTARHCTALHQSTYQGGGKKSCRMSEVGFEPTPTEVDCDLNAAP